MERLIHPIVFHRVMIHFVIDSKREPSVMIRAEDPIEEDRLTEHRETRISKVKGGSPIDSITGYHSNKLYGIVCLHWRLK